MTTPTFTPPPTMPARTQQPAAYITNFNAFLAWLATFFTEMVTAVAWFVTTVAQADTDATTASGAATAAAASAAAAINVTGYVDTSVSSLTPSAAAKAVALDHAGNLFANTDRARVQRRGDPQTWFEGPVSAANMVAKTMTVTPASAADFNDNTGTGPYTDWLVMEAALAPLVEATAAQIRAGSNLRAAMTPGDIYAALVEVVLTDASTIAVDMSTFVNAVVTLGGNRTLGNPSNPKAGQRGRIRIIQDGTGSRTMAFASNWKRTGGAPTLTTTPGGIDLLEYDVITPTYVHYEISRNPS